MNPVLLNIILLVFGAAVGGVASSLILKGRKFVDLEKTQRQSIEMLEKSQLEAKTIKSETESSVEKHKATIAHEVEIREKRVAKLSEGLAQKEEFLKKREERNNELRLRLAKEREDMQIFERNLAKI